MGKTEIEDYLTYLATVRKVSPATQNQAFNAILFLYKEILCINMINLHRGLSKSLKLNLADYYLVNYQKK